MSQKLSLKLWTPKYVQRQPFKPTRRSVYSLPFRCGLLFSRIPARPIISRESWGNLWAEKNLSPKSFMLIFQRKKYHTVLGLTKARFQVSLLIICGFLRHLDFSSFFFFQTKLKSLEMWLDRWHLLAAGVQKLCQKERELNDYFHLTISNSSKRFDLHSEADDQKLEIQLKSPFNGNAISLSLKFRKITERLKEEKAALRNARQPNLCKLG